MKIKELIEELKKQDLEKEVQIKDTIFIGCKKEKGEDGESNTPFFDEVNVPIQMVGHEDSMAIIRINRYA